MEGWNGRLEWNIPRNIPTLGGSLQIEAGQMGGGSILGWREQA